MAYATIEDLEDRYGAIEDAELRARAEVLLEDAATMLDGRVCVDPRDQHQADALRIVSCSMVNRAVAAARDSGGIGLAEATYTMGPFTQTATYANPGGDLYITSGERSLLGLNGSYIGSIPPRIGGPHAW